MTDLSLAVRNLRVGYGSVIAVNDVSFDVRPGQVLAVLGANGAGKSSLLRSIAGLTHAEGGSVELGGEDLSRRSSRARVQAGITLVPEGRELFPNMPVKENLAMGAFARTGRNRHLESWIEDVTADFPRVRERLDQPAGLLSGGEQQMVAIARGLMSGPKVLLLDEPTLGLAPIVVKQVFELIDLLRQRGLAIILVEQSAAALKIAQHVIVLRLGKVVWAGAPAEVSDQEELSRLYLGEIDAERHGEGSGDERSR